MYQTAPPIAPDCETLPPGVTRECPQFKYSMFPFCPFFTKKERIKKSTFTMTQKNNDGGSEK